MWVYIYIYEGVNVHFFLHIELNWSVLEPFWSSELFF